MRSSIRQKLILTVGLPLLLSYAVVLLGDYHLLKRNAISQTRQTVKQQAIAQADRYNTRLALIQQLTQTTAAHTSERTSQADRRVTQALLRLQLRDFLQAIRVQNPFVRSASVVLQLPQLNRPQTNRTQTATSAAAPLTTPPAATLEQTANDIASTIASPANTVPRLLAFQVDDTTTANQTGDLPLPIATQPVMPWLMPDSQGNWPQAGWTEPFTDTTGDHHRSVAYIAPIYLPQTNSQSFDDALDTSNTSESAADDQTQQIGIIVTVVAIEALKYLAQNERDDSFHVLLSNERKPLLALSDTQHTFALPPAPSNPFAQNLEQFNENTPPTLAINQAYEQAANGEPAVIRLNHLSDINPRFESIKGSHFVAFTPVPAINGVFAVGMPEKQALGAVNDRITRRIFFSSAQFVLLVLIVVVLSVRLVRPIEKLSAAVHRLSKGDLQTQASIDSDDEIGRLALAFNQMVTELDRHVQQITQDAKDREKAESQLRVARQIQESLLPELTPPFTGENTSANTKPTFALHAMNDPARQIAGDFYDFFFDQDKQLHAVIADVSGKGVPAAMLMAVTRTLIRQYASAGQTPAQIIQSVNRALFEENLGSMFVTLVYLRLDPQTGLVTYVNAGHPYPLVMQQDGQINRFGEITAPLVGAALEEDIGPIQQAQLTLQPGDMLVLYTDGVTEARNPQTQQMLKENGLRDYLARYAENTSPSQLNEAAQPALPSRTAKSACLKLAKHVRAFQHEQLIDDLTVLTLQRLN